MFESMLGEWLRLVGWKCDAVLGAGWALEPMARGTRFGWWSRAAGCAAWHPSAARGLAPPRKVGSPRGGSQAARGLAPPRKGLTAFAKGSPPARKGLTAFAKGSGLTALRKRLTLFATARGSAPRKGLGPDGPRKGLTLFATARGSAPRKGLGPDGPSQRAHFVRNGAGLRPSQGGHRVRWVRGGRVGFRRRCAGRCGRGRRRARPRGASPGRGAGWCPGRSGGARRPWGGRAPGGRRGRCRA
jgi:hypothetical protein